MSHTCTPILVGVATRVSEIPLSSKTANFPFQTMDYSPWSSKILMDRNRLKKFMQVRIDVKFMHTNFGGRGLKNGQFSLSDHGLQSMVSQKFLVSEIPQPSKTANFPFRTMDYSPWSSKILIDQNRLKKFMQVEIDVTCMHTNFGGRSLFSFGDTKNLINQNRLKKFMQVGSDVACLHTNFGRCRLSGFGDIAAFKNSQFSLSNHGL